MLTELISNGAVAAIDSHGAELSSLRDVFGREYIWQKDARFWKRSAPVLFPIVGALKNGKMTVGGRAYAIGQHGFARDREFRLLSHSKTEAAFSLSWDEDTLAQYPFRFSLKIFYRLEGCVLTVKYRVENAGDEEMLFSIGAHPAFNVPGQRFEDCEIVFERAETAPRLLLNADGLLSGERPFLTGERRIPLTHALFDEDALVFDRLQSRSASLINRVTGNGVRLAFEGFPYFGIWSPRGEAPLVCLEPWLGLASSAGDSGVFSEKRGVQVLPPAQFFDASWSVELI